MSLSVTDTNGVSNNLIVDGRYLAVALACASTSSTVDVATPWTNRNLVGFNGLLRNLDAVDSNKTASAGVTILQQRGALINVRQGLTTDVSSILAKTPTVTFRLLMRYISERETYLQVISVRNTSQAWLVK